MTTITKTLYNFIFLMLLLHPLLSGAQRYDITEDENIIYDNQFTDYVIFKNKKDNTLFITNTKERILVRNLKYCKPLNQDYMQALDRKNKIIYFNDKLRRVKTPKVSIVVCGTVNYYHLKLLKLGDNYFVEKTTDRSFTGGSNTTEITDTIYNDNFDRIYFVNKKQDIDYSDNDLCLDYILFDKGDKHGILSKGKTSMYDAIIIREPYLKIQKSGLFNYYHISPEVKHKRLDNYIFGLAYFELENGKTGYVDIDGNEYKE